MFPVVSPPIFQIIIRKYLKNGAASGTEWSEPRWKNFGKCLCLFGIFQVPLHNYWHRAKHFHQKGKLLSKIGLGPGAPRRGPFSSPNRFQIINNSVVSPPLFQNIIRKKAEKMRCERNGVERASLKKFWKMALPFWNFSSASPYSINRKFGKK